MHKLMSFASVVVVLAMLAAGCNTGNRSNQPNTNAPTAASDTIIVGSFQEPRTMNYLSAQGNQAIRAEEFELFRPNFVLQQKYGFQPNPVLIDGDLPSIEKGTAAQKNVTVPA